MPRTHYFVFALATLSAVSYAQTQDPASQLPPNTIHQAQPAPIVRGFPAGVTPAVTTTQPVAGIWLQTEATSSVKVVSADASKTEIQVERGRVNVQVHHPADNSEILVDLPGGQTTLLKDGLYTFNAETNTMRVLHGEAEVYPGSANSTAKPVKVKEEHELTFAPTSNLKAKEVDPRQMMADLLPGTARAGYEDRGGGYGYEPYGGGYAYGRPYPYGFYPYAGYGWGEPFGWGYPYGYGPGFGFGYYGGFRGGFRHR